jgi:hypothetical protein
MTLSAAAKYGVQAIEMARHDVPGPRGQELGDMTGLEVALALRTGPRTAGLRLWLIGRRLARADQHRVGGRLRRLRHPVGGISEALERPRQSPENPGLTQCATGSQAPWYTGCDSVLATSPDGDAPMTHAFRRTGVEGVLPRLAIRPVDLSATPFSKLEVIGGTEELLGPRQSFRTAPHVSIVIDLLEWDMGASGSVSMLPERQNERSQRPFGATGGAAIDVCSAVSGLIWGRSASVRRAFGQHQGAIVDQHAQPSGLAESIPGP